jgi:hypothetical protein
MLTAEVLQVHLHASVHLDGGTKVLRLVSHKPSEAGDAATAAAESESVASTEVHEYIYIYM